MEGAHGRTAAKVSPSRCITTWMYHKAMDVTLAEAPKTTGLSSLQRADAMTISRCSAETVVGWFMIPPTRRIYMPPITTWAFRAGAMEEAGMCRRQLQRAKQMPRGWFTSQWIRIIRTRCSPDLRVSGALETTARSGG